MKATPWWRRPADVTAVALLIVLPALVFGVPALLGHAVLPGDDMTQNFPLRVLAGREIRSGHVPLFDAYSWSGAPLLAGWNAGAAYPLTWLFAVLPGVAAWTTGLIVTWATAGTGLFWFLRALRLKSLPAFLGALSFALAGAMSAQVTHFSLVAGMSWVPLALLAVLRLSEPPQSPSSVTGHGDSPDTGLLPSGSPPSGEGLSGGAVSRGAASPGRVSRGAVPRGGASRGGVLGRLAWLSPTGHLEGQARRRQVWWTAVLAVAVGLIILAGEPRAIVDGCVAIGIYAIWRVCRCWRSSASSASSQRGSIRRGSTLRGSSRHGSSRQGSWRLGWWGLGSMGLGSWRGVVGAATPIAAGCLLGLCLGGVQWLPGLAAINTSQRGDGSMALFASGSLPPRWLLLTLVPDLLGGSGSLSQPGFFANYNLTEVTSYVGILPLVAALVLLVRAVVARGPDGRRRVPEWLIWHIQAAVGIALALGGDSPLGAVLYRLPLFGSQRLQSRNILLLDLALAILLAYWLDNPFPEQASLKRNASPQAVDRAAGTVAVSGGRRAWGRSAWGRMRGRVPGLTAAGRAADERSILPGSTAQGTTAQGALAQGTTAEGSTAQGPIASGSVTPGLAAQGPVEEGQVAQRSAQWSLARGSMAQGPAPEGSTAKGSMTPGSMAHAESSAHGSVGPVYEIGSVGPVLEMSGAKGTPDISDISPDGQFIGLYDDMTVMSRVGHVSERLMGLLAPVAIIVLVVLALTWGAGLLRWLGTGAGESARVIGRLNPWLAPYAVLAVGAIALVVFGRRLGRRWWARLCAVFVVTDIVVFTILGVVSVAPSGSRPATKAAPTASAGIGAAARGTGSARGTALARGSTVSRGTVLGSGASTAGTLEAASSVTDTSRLVGSGAAVSGIALLGVAASKATASGADLTSRADASGAATSRTGGSGAATSGVDAPGTDTTGAGVSGAGVSGASASGASASGANETAARPVRSLGYSGRFAIYDPDLLDTGDLSVLGPPDDNAMTFGGMPSVQGYSSIVDGTYATATGSHSATGDGQNVLSPAAIGNGTLDALDTTVLLTLPQYLTTTPGDALPAPGPPGTGSRSIGPGQEATWYLGQSVTVSRVTVPDSDAKQDAASGAELGLTSPNGRTQWFPARAAGASTLEISLARPVTATAVLGRAGVSGHAHGTSYQLGAPSIIRVSGGILVANGQLQNVLVLPRWNAAGFDGGFAVFADQLASGPLSVLPLPGQAGSQQTDSRQPSSGRPGSGHSATVEQVTGGGASASISAADASVRYTTSAAGDVTTATVSSANGVRLVRSMAAIPGWSATWQPVDGQPVTLKVQPDGVVQAVDVPPGRGTVTWHYVSPRFTAGLAVSGVGTLLTLLLAVFGTRRPSARLARRLNPQAT